jgi:hypothetical protein
MEGYNGPNLTQATPSPIQSLQQPLYHNRPNNQRPYNPEGALTEAV